MDKKIKYLTEEKSEKYILLVVGVIVLVIDILLWMNVLTIKTEYPVLMKVVLLIFSIIGIIISINNIKKEQFYKKSVFHKLVKEYTADDIIKRLSSLMNAKEKLNVLKEKNCVSFVYECKKGTFEAYIHVKEISFLFDVDEEYYNTLSESKMEFIDNLDVEYNPLEISCEEIFNNFIKFVNDNKDRI